MILTGFLFGLGFIVAITFFYFAINNLELILPFLIVFIAAAVIVACVIIGIVYWEQALTITLYIGAIALIGYVTGPIFNSGKEISDINASVEQRIEELRKKRTKPPVTLLELAVKRKYILLTVFLVSTIGFLLSGSLSENGFDISSVWMLLVLPVAVTLITLIILLILY